MAATTKPRGSPKRPRPVGATIDPAALAQVPALERVLAWASERGGVFDGLRLALDAHGGVGLYAARDFAPGDTLAFVPRACALTAATARESALGQRILAAAAEWGALAEATDELVLCVFLNWARAEPSCEWHPLVAAMPAQSPEPCCWPEPIRTELAGTPVGLAVSTAIARFALHAARLTTRLAAAGIIPEATASHEALLWARGMYHSRGYTGRLASLEAAAAPAGLPTPNGGADGLLLPIVDLMNHRHGQPITWQVEPDGVRFVAGAAVLAGEEVCTNYGARPNEELIFSYGFALQEPAAEAVSLVLAEQRGGDADGAPRARDSGVAVRRQTHYVRRLEHGGIPPSLLRALAHAAGAGDAAEPAARADGRRSAGEQPDLVERDAPAPAEGSAEVDYDAPADASSTADDDTVVLSGEALELLLAVLCDKRDALRPSASADSRALKRAERARGAPGETDVRRRVAVAIYRDGQRRVLKEAIAAVRALLDTAIEEGDGAGEAEAEVEAEAV